MQDSARMRIERDYGWHCFNRTSAFDNGAHDQLMAQMQTIKDAKRQDSRSLDLGVISSVKKSHEKLVGAALVAARFG